MRQPRDISYAESAEAWTSKDGDASRYIFLDGVQVSRAEARKLADWLLCAAAWVVYPEEEGEERGR